MDPIHLRLAEIGLRVAGRYGFALAGGYAVQAHGILDRPSEDIDLFTAWDRRGDFAAAVDAVVDGYRAAGYAVDVVRQFETFAQLAVTDPATPERPYKVELAANWRSLPPVVMDVGPVLHMDDVVAGKMSALFTRAEPRDFLDVDAAVMTGYYTRERLLELAGEADAGFDRRIFADLLAVLHRYPDRRFAAYEATPDHIAAMRKRFEEWRDQLAADPT
ncbi:nucleotidyl transferase AbiEii/AbiGii toxin family protein [Paractinoplanes rishiriensis]|uniref:Nucleotidyltransferase AbiEii toxin of type IV toxin-antitoxin system n=1 Tax=Paractinoplanes rishiriensis TaxID=1050105 RepID=A0A919MQK4_9ACTN|nr:nucleotidyl transferase AbiEii/AbiGii toxin family protein [Actinoplanes rishiriensis]GIE96246.1 hypothetical protein Ari01nite_37110 [Actinoplanes rishiriensis]